MNLFFFLVIGIGAVMVFSLFQTVQALKEKLQKLEWKLARLENSFEKQQQPTQAESIASKKELLHSVASEAEEPAVFTPEVPPILEPIAPPVIAQVMVEENIKLPPQLAPAVPPLLAAKKVVDWEKFLGVNLFAWIGGLALFIGVSFFVKYSFEHNLISPAMRVALGYCVGLGLLIGGVVMRNKSYEVTSQTLCATGVVVFYGVTFAAQGMYHLFGSMTAFALMSVVTAVAFVLAVRMEAKVVAVLGLVGGFLTPPLLSTGVDNPVGLFGYIGLLQIGLVAIAFRRNWTFLLLLGGIGTGLMELGWMVGFFRPEKIGTAFNIFLMFNVLSVAALALFEKFQKSNDFSVKSVVIQAAVTFIGFAFFVHEPLLSVRPGLVLLTLLLGDLSLLALTFARNDLFRVHVGAGGVTFLLLGTWIRTHFSESLLYWGLAATLFFALLHSVYPRWLQWIRKIVAPVIWANLFPLVALGIILLSMFQVDSVSFLVWPVVLLLDLLVLALAFFSASIFVAAGALALTAILSATWIFRVPADFSDTSLLAIVVLFTGVFVWGTLWLLEKGAGGLAGEISEENEALVKFIPASAAILPFLLLSLMLMRFRFENPSKIFAVAMMLDVVLLWLGRRMRAEGFDIAALGATLFLTGIWHQSHCNPVTASLAMGWHIGFYFLFFVNPFLFSQRVKTQVMPWAVSSLAGPLHFYLIYNAFKMIAPNFSALGLIPAAMAIPGVAGLYMAAKKMQIPVEHRNRVLAWVGGSALFFVTFIFPIQFEHQWLTLGWALEGLALVWLFRKIPERWLALVGIGLLTISFGRLALNMNVFGYYPRSGVRIFNWYLYSYGIVAGCLFGAARLLPPTPSILREKNAPPLLYTLGTILLFILLNIEIADFFAEGTRLTFEFSTRFDRDMTYSIGWALFALGLLVIGIRKELKAVRYSALGLIGVTLMKLFFHDLRQLGQLYRVGAFMGVAVILIFASWIYQRYLASTAESNTSQAKS
jgi:uncharacterized membrane protein